MALDLAHRQPSRVKADDLVVEAIEAGLPLGDQPRFERTGAVARYLNLDFALIRQNRLRARAVAAIAAAAARRIALLVAKVIAQLRSKRPLDQRLLETPENPVLVRQVFRFRIATQYLIQNLG